MSEIDKDDDLKEAQEIIEAILQPDRDVSLIIRIKDSEKARCILRSLFLGEDNPFGFHVLHLGFRDEVTFLRNQREKLQELLKRHQDELSQLLSQQK